MIRKNKSMMIREINGQGRQEEWRKGHIIVEMNSGN